MYICSARKLCDNGLRTRECHKHNVEKERSTQHVKVICFTSQESKDSCAGEGDTRGPSGAGNIVSSDNCLPGVFIL